MTTMQIRNAKTARLVDPATWVNRAKTAPQGSTTMKALSAPTAILVSMTTTNPQLRLAQLVLLDDIRRSTGGLLDTKDGTIRQARFYLV